MTNKIDILLNRSIPFDGEKIRILDQVTISLNGSNLQQITFANQVWATLREDPTFWFQSDKILQNSTYPYTKFIMLVVLQDAIKHQWLALPLQQRKGIKGYIINIVSTYGSQANLQKTAQSILSKANSILVHIVKYEWNTTWTQFIPQIIDSINNNQNSCENCLIILRMLSEQIFDFSKNQMTNQQIIELKQKMYQEFTKIFQLCSLILSNKQNVKMSLLKSCLETLEAFLEWIPSYYIYFTDISNKLIQSLTNHQIRSPALKCLIEIGSLKIEDSEERLAQIKNKVYLILNETINKLNLILPITQDFISIKRLKHKSEILQFQIMCQNIALFFTSILRQQYSWLIQENSSSQPISIVVRNSLNYLVKLLRIDDDQQTSKIIIQFFHFLTKQVVQQKFKPKPLLYSRDLISDIYGQIFNQVTSIIVLRMAKPQQVLIVLDQQGQPTRQLLTNTQNNSWYELMKQLLINLAQYNWTTTRQYIQTKIQRQNTNQFSFDILNSLSWAVGSLNGFIPEGEEKTFLIAVIRTLLQLCENKKGKNNKAVVASCIMYVVGQYPTFLKGNWNFLKTVVKKLFEFMKQTFEGVMQMACNTFLKIAISTKQQFVIPQQNEGQPYIYDLIRKIPQETRQLKQQSLRLIFYEAVGHIISSQPNNEIKTVLMKNTLKTYLDEFLNIVQFAQNQIEVLKQEQAERKLIFFIRINERLAFSVGLPYGSLLIQLNDSLNKIYLYYSNEINNNVKNYGKNVLNYLTNKRMRIINKEILKIYNTYINRCQIHNIGQVQSIIQSFVNPLEPLLIDYAQTNQDAKEPEFLNLLTVIFQRLNVGLKPDYVNRVLQIILKSTLSLITTDFNSYPEIRMAFFYFLTSIIRFNLEQLFNLAEDNFDTIIKCVVWLFKHELNTFCDMGLQLLNEILVNVNKNKMIVDIFYDKYFISLLKDVLQVLTDASHKSGVKLQSKILFILIQVVTSNLLSVNISNGQFPTNAEYIYKFLENILCNSFSNVSKQSTCAKLNNMFLTKDEKEFRHEVADYLVMIKRYSLQQQQDIIK